MTAPILVTGGTGTLGRLLVPRLRAAGRTVRVLSRGPDGDVRGDLNTGDGLAEALAGAATVVHCAGSVKGDDEKTRRLVRAAAAAGKPHLVFISVVGADRVPVTGAVDRAMFGYFAAKRGAELAVEESGLPWTTLRATQFHDLVLGLARQLAKLPVLPVPAVRYQPVDAGEVAERMTELALGEPAGLVDDFGGPEVRDLPGLVRDYLQVTGRRRPIVRMRAPGRAGAAIRAGAVLSPEHAAGKRTWAQFLAALPAPPPARPRRRAAPDRAR